jgi:uncharacterized protein with NAD-binding domain and iron-sulfur cluster
VTKVVVLGGGVAGLSAAHELGQRGFDVTVYEQRPKFGGKARSMPVPKTRPAAIAGMPAEHGFRFFPGFYQHVPDTMARIPEHPGAQRTVADHLTKTTRVMVAHAGGDPLVAPANAPSSTDDFRVAIKCMWEVFTDLGIKPSELMAFSEKLLTLLVSCDARRYSQWEQISWWQYSGAERRSPLFQKFLADGLTRSLVAARAREISARTGGLILCQLLFCFLGVLKDLDRVLDGPTSEVWIDPWVDHLRNNPAITLRDSCGIAGIHCDGRRITAVTIEHRGRTERVDDAEFYVAALPVERLRMLTSPTLSAAERRLAGLSALQVRWMNGAMFYLKQDVPLEYGHTIFIDSEWSLTAISQQQFWPDVDLTKRGNGQVHGILSVDISEWQNPGSRTGKVAMACSPDEIREEVWGQMVDHLGAATLKKSNIAGFHLDDDVRFPNPSDTINFEPLLINTAGSWARRPEAVTRIPNLFLAADFVRTYTDLATMEAANEAARRAVNGILDATGSTAARCRIWKLYEPPVLAPFRELDKLCWRLRRPVELPVRMNPDGELEPANPLVRGLLAATRCLR